MIARIGAPIQDPSEAPTREGLLEESRSEPGTESQVENLGSGLVMSLIAIAIGAWLTRPVLRWVAKLYQPVRRWSLKLDPFVLFEVFMIFLGLMLIGGSLLGDFESNESVPEHVKVLSGLAIVTAINIMVVAYVFLRNRTVGGTVQDLGLLVPPTQKRHPLAFVAITLVTYLAFAPLWMGLSLIQEIVVEWFGGTLPKQEAVSALEENQQIATNVLFLFGVCVTTPILEELLFRGFLYGMIRQRLGPWLSLLLTSAFFMLVHDAGQFQVFLLGFYLAWIYEKTRSLTVPIAIHIWHNSLTVLAIHVLPMFGVTD